MNSKKYTIFSILFLLVLSALMMLRQLKTPAYFSSFIADSFTYTSRAWQFIEALKKGVIYPRWLSLDFWGYGSPTFIIYSPLAFYIVSLFNVFTNSLIVAMNITKFMALFLSAVGMFFLVKEFYSEKIALMTASFYILFPYNIFQFYSVGTFSSTVSFMWFSPTILFTYRYIKNRKYKDILYAGACYGGLILTHLINAYMFTFVLIAFIIYMSINKKRPKDLIVIPAIVIIGILISSAYVFPLIYEKQLINIRAFIGEGEGWPFYYFLILPNLTSRLPADHFWTVHYNRYIYYVFFFCIFILLFLLQILKLRHDRTMGETNIVNKFLLGVSVISLFFLFGISTFIWEIIPFFKYIQFPSRWLNITTFAVIFLSSSVFYTLVTFIHNKKRNHIFIALLFLTFLFLDYKYISSSHVFNVEKLIPVKPINWDMCVLPMGVDINKIDKDIASKEKAFVIKGKGKTKITKWSSAERVIELVADQPITVRIRTFNFPGWKAYIDGGETEIKTEKDVGAMLIDIPEGEHRMVLKFEDTPVRYYSKLISLLSFISIVVISIFSKKKIAKEKAET
jgi:uncharacterized membrane protein